MEEQTDTEKRV